MENISTHSHRKYLKRGRSLWKSLESLESKVLLDGEDPFDLLSAIDTGAAVPVITVDAGQSTPGASWLTPSAIRNWYGYNSVSFGHGTITGDGAGQTIAIIDWGHDPRIGSDLAAFDSQFSYSASTSSFFAVYAQIGTTNGFDLASNISAAFCRRTHTRIMAQVFRAKSVWTWNGHMGSRHPRKLLWSKPTTAFPRQIVSRMQLRLQSSFLACRLYP